MDCAAVSYVPQWDSPRARRCISADKYHSDGRVLEMAQNQVADRLATVFFCLLEARLACSSSNRNGPWVSATGVCASATTDPATVVIVIAISSSVFIRDCCRQRPVTGTRTRSGCEEVADRRCDLCGMGFQREVPRVEETDDRTRNIALEGLGA